jgi:hypothetical protein
VRKPYEEPKLTRFGAFRDLTQQSQGKSFSASDLLAQHEQCNPNPGAPGQSACS